MYKNENLSEWESVQEYAEQGEFVNCVEEYLSKELAASVAVVKLEHLVSEFEFAKRSLKNLEKFANDEFDYIEMLDEQDRMIKRLELREKLKDTKEKATDVIIRFETHWHDVLDLVTMTHRPLFESAERVFDNEGRELRKKLLRITGQCIELYKSIIEILDNSDKKLPNVQLEIIEGEQ